MTVVDECCLLLLYDNICTQSCVISVPNQSCQHLNKQWSSQLLIFTPWVWWKLSVYLSIIQWRNSISRGVQYFVLFLLVNKYVLWLFFCIGSDGSIPTIL